MTTEKIVSSIIEDGYSMLDLSLWDMIFPAPFEEQRPIKREVSIVEAEYPMPPSKPAEIMSLDVFKEYTRNELIKLCKSNKCFRSYCLYAFEQFDIDLFGEIFNQRHYNEYVNKFCMICNDIAIIKQGFSDFITLIKENQLNDKQQLPDSISKYVNIDTFFSRIVFAWSCKSLSSIDRIIDSLLALQVRAINQISDLNLPQDSFIRLRGLSRDFEELYHNFKNIDISYKRYYDEILSHHTFYKIEIDKHNKQCLEITEQTRIENERRRKVESQEYEAKLSEWQKRETQYNSDCYSIISAEMNEKKLLEQGDPAQIELYYTELFRQTKCFEVADFDVQVDYKQDSKTLIVEYQLPLIDDIPNVKLRNQKYTKCSASELASLYDRAIYAIVIRILMEIFHHDIGFNIDAIALNGYVIIVNKATGKKERRCITSIFVKRSEFEGISPLNVDPKECFKYLKCIYYPKTTPYNN